MENDLNIIIGAELDVNSKKFEEDLKKLKPLSVTLKTLLDITDGSVKKHFNEIQKIVNSQKPIKIQTELDNTALDLSKSESELTKSSQKIKNIFANISDEISSKFSETFGIVDEKALKEITKLSSEWLNLSNLIDKTNIENDIFDKTFVIIKEFDSLVNDAQETWKSFVDYVNGSRIRMDKFGADYENARRAFGVNVITSKSGTPIETWYAEARESGFSHILPDVDNVEDQFQALSDALLRGREKLKASSKITDSEIQAIWGGQTGIKNAVSEILGQISIANQETNDTKIELPQVDFENYADVENYLNHLNALESKLEGLSDSEKKITLDFDNTNIIKAVETIDSSAESAVKNITELSESAKTASNGTVDAVDAMASALLAAGVAKTLKEIKDLLWNCVDASVKFESALADVRKTTNFPISQMQGLKSEILSLSSEIPIVNIELSKIAEIGGQLNIPKENIIDFTKIMAKLGVTTTLTSEQAADFVARFSNITQMPMEKWENFSSALVRLGNSFAGTETEISDMALRLASAGKQAKMTEADILGLSTGLVAVGIKAEMGGTAFSKAMNQINIAVATGNDELKDFARIAGMSVQEFTDTFNENANTALIAFIKGLADVERHGKNTIVLMDELGLTEVRMSDALRRAAGSGELFQNAIEQSNAAFVENVALQNEASIRFETTESKMKLLSNATDQLKIAIGDSLNPAVNTAVGGLTNFTLGTAEFLEQNKWLVQAFTVLTVLVGTATGGIALYAVGIKALTTAKAALGITVTGTTATIKAFSATLLATPLGKAIIALSAIATIAAALTIVMGENNKAQEEARRKSIEYADTAKQQANNLKDLYAQYERLTNIANHTTDEEAQFKDIQSQIIPLLGERKQILEGLTKGTKEYAEALKQATGAELVEQLTTVRRGRVAAGGELTSENNSVELSNYALKYNDLVKDYLTPYLNAKTGNLVKPKGADEALQFHTDLNKALQLLDEQYNKLYENGDKAGAEAIVQSKFYKDLSSTINDMNGNVTKYLDLKVQEASIQYVFANGYPQTISSLDVMKDSVFNLVGVNGEFRNQTYDMIDNMFPSLVQSANETTNANTEIEKSFKALSDTISEVSDKMSIYTSIKKDLAESNQLSESTMKKLVDSDKDYLQYFDVINGKLSFSLDLYEQYKIKLEEDAIAQEKLNLAKISANYYEALYQKNIAKSKEVTQEDISTLENQRKEILLSIQSRASFIKSLKSEASESEKLIAILKDVSDNYSKMIKAQGEMGKDGGLSPDTTLAFIQELTKAGENYLDYLYVENGQMKLNTEKYEAWVTSKIQNNTDLIKSNADLTESEKQTLLEIQQALSKSVEQQGYEQERKNIEADYKDRILTAQEYYSQLTDLRNKYFEEGSVLSVKYAAQDNKLHFEALSQELNEMVRAYQLL